MTTRPSTPSGPGLSRAQRRKPVCKRCSGTGWAWSVPAGVNPFEVRLPTLSRMMFRARCHCPAGRVALLQQDTPDHAE